MAAETAQRMRDAIRTRYRIAVVVALGCGLRQGEVFGLSPEDVDFQRGVIRVRRQVQLLNGRLYFTLPKAGKTRIVDMPGFVAAELAAHFLQYAAVEVELPWGGPEPEREKRTFPLVLTTTYGNALRANIFNDEVWKPALAAAGVIPMREKGKRWKASRKDGFHVLRHTFASMIVERTSPSSPWPADRPLQPDHHPRPLRPLHAGGWREGTSGRRRAARCGPRVHSRHPLQGVRERVVQHTLCHPFRCADSVAVRRGQLVRLVRRTRREYVFRPPGAPLMLQPPLLAMSHPRCSFIWVAKARRSWISQPQSSVRSTLM